MHQKQILLQKKDNEAIVKQGYNQSQISVIPTQISYYDQKLNDKA